MTETQNASNASTDATDAAAEASEFRRGRTAEERRLEEDNRRDKIWKRWGPYLSERQWGTVREDYSPDGDVLVLFPARSCALARLSLGRRWLDGLH